MTLEEAMRARHMVRKYIDKPLPENIVAQLNQRIEENNRMHHTDIRLMLNDTNAYQGIVKLLLAKGVKNYFIMAGDEAPDIALPDPDGNVRRLSDLRGRLVLIDFWASWCRPCRMENPNVVRLYERYHNYGFEVFSVSLDNNRDAWLKAINDDHLSWPNHVSDLRGWSSAGGRLYGIQSIPATVLVAPDGKILARNLRGPDLENALNQIFGQK